MGIGKIHLAAPDYRGCLLVCPLVMLTINGQRQKLLLEKGLATKGSGYSQMKEGVMIKASH